MSHYRRWYQPGGCYFFTVVTYRRRRLFDSALARDLLGRAIREIAAETPFRTLGIVLLPDHLHALWVLPPGDADFSTRWQRIKARFTELWLAAGGDEAVTTPSQRRRGHRGVWQRRFFEHLLRDEQDLEDHCDYLHYNPVKHGYVERVADWLPSSFHRFVREGIYPADWGQAEPASILGMDYE
jgi:putative transposase